MVLDDLDCRYALTQPASPFYHQWRSTVKGTPATSKVFTMQSQFLPKNLSAKSMSWSEWRFQCCQSKAWREKQLFKYSLPFRTAWSYEASWSVLKQKEPRRLLQQMNWIQRSHSIVEERLVLAGWSTLLRKTKCWKLALWEQPSRADEWDKFSSPYL